MDSQEVLERESERGGEGSRFLARCCFSVFFVISVSFSLSFLFGLVALAIGSTSASPPVSVPANCRIISSSECFLMFSSLGFAWSPFQKSGLRS